MATLTAALSEVPAPPIDPRSAADELAIAVRRDWWYETERWHILDPYPLPVRWVPADPDLVAGWPALVRLARASPGVPSRGGDAWASGPAGLAGGDNDLGDVLRRIPTGRLVVLGQPGAGKTILLVRLVLDLLSRRAPGDPVPVLLPLASWNLPEENLENWIVRWLTTGRTGIRVSLARALLDAGLILPVLDGLDEIAEKLRGLAIARINDAMRPSRRMVLAART